MSLLRPQSGSGRLCILCLWLAFGLAFFCAIIFGVVSATGCNVNEAGAGSCKVLEIEMISPLSVLSMLAVIYFFVGAPILLITALISGIMSAFRRRW